jgi:hypothetical protein
MSKPWYRSRIIWFNAFVAVAGAVIGLPEAPRWIVAALTVLVPMVNVILRYDTDTEIQ